MVNVVARLKVKGKNFEILVDCDKANELRKNKNVNKGTIRDIISIDSVFIESKKGIKPSSSDLKDAFGTEDFFEIAAKIVAEGEIQLLPNSHKGMERVKDCPICQAVELGLTPGEAVLEAHKSFLEMT